jgi:putative ABC transport system permease protein
MDLTPQAITAFMLGLNNKISTFALQREINEFRGEPMLAILPGVALQELWSLMGTAEKPVRGLAVRGADRADRHAHGDSHQPQRAPPRDGDPAFGGRAAVAHRDAAGAGSVCPGAVRRGRRRGAAVCGIAAAQGYVQANYGLYLPLAWPSEYEWTLLGGILAPRC